MDPWLDRVIAHYPYLSPVDEVTRLSGGSNSAVYRIGDYIVKISALSDSVQFEREGAAMDRLQGKIHVPRNLVNDVSRALIPRNFSIQSYVEGPLLADCWAGFSEGERREYLEQICGQLVEIFDLPAGFAPPLRAADLAWYLNDCARRGSIPADIREKLEGYLDLHGELASKDPVVTHGDLTFYNMILSESERAIYFIDFDSVFVAPRERELAALASSAFSWESPGTHHIHRSRFDLLALARECRPEWFSAEQLVETMRLFFVPRLCWQFDASEKSGLSREECESKGRLLYRLYFEDPVWQAYLRGDRFRLD